MILPELEPIPDVEGLMFFDAAVIVSQQLGIVASEATKLSRDHLRGHITKDEFNIQNTANQAKEDRLSDQKKSIIDGLPDELREGAYHFFTLLPHIRDAVANIRNGEADVHVAEPNGNIHKPTTYLAKALLLGAWGTGYTLTARIGNDDGYVIASPEMSFKDVEWFVPEPN